jgi:hypothetical protein
MSVHQDGRDDLAEVIIRPTGLYPLCAGEVIGQLAATGNIRVWADRGMTTLLASPGSPKTWDLSSDTIPSTVYVEGTAAGTGQLTWTVAANAHEVAEDRLDFMAVPAAWKRVGTWTASSAKVEAQIANASLEELANDITGNPGDAALLKVSGSIKRHTKVNVLPLIRELDRKIRSNVVAATQAHKYAHFPVGGEPFIDAKGLTGEQVVQIFAVPEDPNDAGPAVDCLGMARIVEVYGLIECLKGGEFGKLFSSTDEIPGATRNCELKSARIGDWLYFWNDKRYPDVHDGGPMRGENVITVDTDVFWGWGDGQGGQGTYEQWLKALVDAYNAGLPKSRQITHVPGYQPTEAKFFNVPKIAMEIFDLRTGPQR